MVTAFLKSIISKTMHLRGKLSIDKKLSYRWQTAPHI